MRYAFFFAFGLVTPITTSHAQSLDLDSLTLRVGEDSAVAIANLRNAYDVTYQAAFQSWLVMRKGWKPSDSFVYLASVVVKEGHISSILKYYDLGDGSDLSTVYSTALRDAQRDQTGPCLTTLVRGSDQSVQTIKTLCGHYEVDFHLAHIDSANSGRSTTSISVFVR